MVRPNADPATTLIIPTPTKESSNHNLERGNKTKHFENGHVPKEFIKVSKEELKKS